MNARLPRDPDPGGADEPALDDPFTAADPEARAREERRLERERRRRERAQRRRDGGSSRDGAAASLKGLFSRGQRTPGNGATATPPAPEREAERAAERRRPIGRRVGARARAGGVPRRVGARPRAEVVRRRRIAAGIALVLGVLVLWFLVSLWQPFGGSGDGRLMVSIPEGATADQVAEILESEGVIGGGMALLSAGDLFRLRLSIAGKGDEIQSGQITLASGMSYGAAIEALTAPASEQGITVVIPEGYTRNEIAVVARDAGLEGNYKKASRSSKRLDPRDYGAPGDSGLEGFLFPATYELGADATAGDLVTEQLKAFKQNFREVNMKYARSKNLSPYDVLTIASLVDKEVQVPKERKRVAEVIYNRLQLGEPLGIDATIRYATGNHDEQLKESELATDSPYNTRLVAGLPPTPIGNPGLDAIEAAADPGRGDLRFFVVKPGTCGEHVFSDNEEDFNRAAERYQRALEREGGSPTEC